MDANENLSSLISAAVTAKMTPEFIEKEVNTRVEKLVIESINNALRMYSPAGKEIERAVQEALKVDRLDLPSYGSTISKILKAQIEARVSEVVAGRLSADMEELLGLAPKAIKLSQIADLMRKEHESDGKWGEVISVVVEETGYYSRWLYLDERQAYSHHDRRQCQYHLLVGADGIISSASLGGRNLKETSHVGRSYGMDQMIRAWVACGTKIEFDEDFVVTSVGD